MRIYLTILLIGISFWGCKQGKEEPNIEMAITQLTDKYTQLPKGKSNPVDFYKLIRTVIIGEKNIQLQLYSMADNSTDQQQIVIIINPQGKYYAIPFFSNTYRDYWKFEFDKPISTIKKVNTTFEKEFMNAINTLNLNDTAGTGLRIFNELVSSLINCEKVSENDSSHFAGISLKNNFDIPAEDFDSCFLRQQKNFEAIKKGINPSKSFYIYNAFWDKHNERIYQILNQSKTDNKKFNLSIKVYRQDCTYHLVRM